MAYIYLSIAFILNAAASIFLKLQSIKGLYIKPVLSAKIITNNTYFLIALVLFGLNVIFYTLALSRMALSVANVTMVVMSFLIVSIFSFVYFKEDITLYQGVGYVLIIIGLVLVIGYE